MSNLPHWDALQIPACLVDMLIMATNDLSTNLASPKLDTHRFPRRRTEARLALLGQHRAEFPRLVAEQRPSALAAADCRRAVSADRYNPQRRAFKGRAHQSPLREAWIASNSFG